ncbi:MAG: L,D-transpeptidase family protein, partial [Planctomycetota bacterium]
MSIRGRINLRRSLLLAGSLVLAAALAALAVRVWWPSAWARVRARLSGERTVSDVVARIGPRVRPDLRRAFREAGECAYPPARLLLVALKRERRLEVWAPDPDGRMRLVKTHPVLGASGGPGPKLREGDRQVPEGFYLVEGLNPNSAFHLSIRLDYPNDFDLRMAERDGRASPGGDIYI